MARTSERNFTREYKDGYRAPKLLLPLSKRALLVCIDIRAYS